MIDAVHVGDCVDVLRRLPDRSVDLVILDPPYWKVSHEDWDFQWRTEADYAAWCLTWLREVSRVSTRGASLYLFGYMRNLLHMIGHVTG
jgi:DNA modification methylase